MKSKFVTHLYRASILTLPVLILMLSIPPGLHSGYAEGPLQQTKPVWATASESAKPDVPSICSPVGFSLTTYPVGDSPWGLEVGDFNSDGNADLVAANGASHSVSVLLGNGNGTFPSRADYPAAYGSFDVAVADLFGDQIDDLMVAGLDDHVAYLQGNGDGTFFPPYEFDMSNLVSSTAVDDFNNDSWPDLVTTSASAYMVTVRMNNGEGDLEAPTYNALNVRPYSVAIGDFNGDGNADLAIANGGVNSVSVLLGNGNGYFQSPISFSTGDGPYKVAIGDFNRDGNADMATANTDVNSVSVLLGNGDGLFQAAVNFAVGDTPRSVAVGDFNSDGIADLVATNEVSNNVSVLLGNGDGSFQTALSFGAGAGPSSVVVGDFNRDSKPDIATTNPLADSVSVLLNTCVSATNTPTPTPLPTQTPGGPTATPQACLIQFADVAADNTFYPFVRCLACRGIISGYSCGGIGEPCNGSSDPYFRPSSPVSRGQLAKIVSNSAGFSNPVSGQSFEDVLPGSAFYTFVERLVAREVMGGYACGGVGEPCGTGNLPYFRPGSGATRGQLTKIVSNAAGFTDPAPGTYTFTDVPVGSTFHLFVERLLTNRPGAMGGYACGGTGEPCDAQNRAYFRPANPLSRGQTSKIVGNTFFPSCEVRAGAKF